MSNSTDSEYVPILRAKSAAQRFGVSEAWLIAEARAGRLPGVVTDTTALFPLPDLERALVDRARDSMPKEPQE